MRKLMVCAGIALGTIIGLGGCAASPSAYTSNSVENPAATAWFRSSRGDVSCLYKHGGQNSYGYVNCDWSTLSAAGAHTNGRSPALKIELVTTNRGTVQCASSVDAVTDDAQTPSCDWSTLTTGGVR